MHGRHLHYIAVAWGNQLERLAAGPASGAVVIGGKIDPFGHEPGIIGQDRILVDKTDPFLELG